jgi:hypothetical protein
VGIFRTTPSIVYPRPSQHFYLARRLSGAAQTPLQTMATPEPIKKKPPSSLSTKPAVPSPLSRSVSTPSGPNKRPNKPVAPNPPKTDSGFNQLSFRHAALFPPSTRKPDTSWPQGWERLQGLARPHLDGFDALDGKDGLLARVGSDLGTMVVFDGIGRGPASAQTGTEELGNKIEGWSF